MVEKRRPRVNRARPHPPLPAVPDRVHEPEGVPPLHPDQAADRREREPGDRAEEGVEEGGVVGMGVGGVEGEEELEGGRGEGGGGEEEEGEGAEGGGEGGDCGADRGGEGGWGGGGGGVEEERGFGEEDFAGFYVAGGDQRAPAAGEVREFQEGLRWRAWCCHGCAPGGGN